MVPLTKIQMPAPIIHVVLDQPGYRRNVGIPWPHGLVTVAVKAGAPDQRPRSGRIPRRLPDRWRIRVVAAVRNELNQDRGHQHPFGNLDKHASVLVGSAPAPGTRASNACYML